MSWIIRCMHSATLRARGCVRLLRGACAAAERRGRDARRHRHYQTQFPAGDSQSMVTAPPQSCHSVAPRTWHTAGARSGAGGFAPRTHLAHRWCAIWGGGPHALGGRHPAATCLVHNPSRQIQYSNLPAHTWHTAAAHFTTRNSPQQVAHSQNSLGYFLRLQHFSIQLLHQ